jgi:iron(III) transport system ATP-binding protein
MVNLVAKNISHSYDGLDVIKDVSLEVGAGELVCLLGPSGCGKSTLMRLLAGLEEPDVAEIAIDGKTVAGKKGYVPVEKRNVGMVFQSPSLFPHLNVLKNVMFGVKGKKSEAKIYAQELLIKVGLEGQSEKYPHQLSGGQQQRVAIARALAPKPDILMLDEPFANLDTVLRKTIRVEAARMLKEAGVATLLVTHDPEEALQMADRIYVMEQGVVVQRGTPFELYNKPINAFVAGFFGDLNALEVRVNNNKLHTVFGELNAQKVACHNLGKDVCELIDDGARVMLYLRPETLALTSAAKGATQAIVETVRFLGFASLVQVRLKANNTILQVRVTEKNLPEIGAEVGLTLDDNQAFVFKQ